MKTVYWSPWFFPSKNDYHWNILFEEPERLLDSILKEFKEKYKDDDRNIKSLKCPAISNVSKNTFFIKNPLATELKVLNNKIEYLSEHYLNSTLEGKNNILYGMPFIFFCEEDLEIQINAPFFHNSNYLNYAKLFFGRFNISKWFRPINLEMILEDHYLKIEQNEPLCYFNFLTDDKVVLKRFQMTDKLIKISETCATVSSWWKNVPLIKRYDRFVKSKTNKIILKEIQKQLVD